MLCALQPPTPMQQDIKPSPHLSHPHDYSTSTHSHYKSSLGSTFSRYSPPESPRHLPSFFTNGVAASHDTAMSGSSGHAHSQSQHPPPSSIHHRGLPPPTGSGFALPPPTPTSTDPHHRPSSVAPPQPPPPPSQHQSHATGGVSLGQLPAPPATWSSSIAPSDDSMRSWLHAKAEEDRRRQEEEKTAQEKVRLEQRRLERDMLRESLDRGIPPAMVPLIFAGLGAGTGVGVSQAIEFAQSWMQGLTLQQQQQQPLAQGDGSQPQQQALPSSEPQRIAYEQQLRHQQAVSSPDLRREREREQQAARDRMIPSNPYATSQPQQQLPSHAQQQPPLSSHRTSFSAVGPAPTSALSKLNTVDFTPSAATVARQGLHPSLSASNLSTFTREGLREEPSATSTSGTTSGQGSGAGLFFHHWTPPTGTGAGQGGGSGQPPTPSGKSIQGSPYGSQGSGTHGHLRKQQGPAAAADWENSPKKRKMTHTTGSAGGSGSSGGSATRAALSAPGAATIGAAQAAADEAAESESNGSGREMEREGREPLRPSSRQQRLEEREGLGGGHPHPHGLAPPPPQHQHRYDERGPSG